MTKTALLNMARPIIVGVLGVGHDWLPGTEPDCKSLGGELDIDQAPSELSGRGRSTRVKCSSKTFGYFLEPANSVSLAIYPI